MSTVSASLEPTAEQFERLAALPDEGPIVMINLLRYREQAAYPPESTATACSGREAYRRYSETALPLVVQAGGSVVWMGSAVASVIGPADEAWDDAVLVEYPSKQAFLGMVAQPAYLEVVGHRSAALADSRLIATRTLLSNAATVPGASASGEPPTG